MRSHYCGLVDQQLAGRLVTVCGWVDTRRDHGGVIFIDLRDHEGVVQCVVEPDQAEAFKVAEGVRTEYCLRIEGRVRLRPDGLANDRLRTGAIELVAQVVEVLARADPLPFGLDESPAEDIRLRYRYLDLRRPTMQANLRTRTRLVQALRRHLDERGFLDLETPILTRATPEGARDFLVPSRVHAGEFYALPQSPQLFKQLFMVAGMDRYYQIARCFRDEDLRSDRQLEFTQLDIEMSFVAERELQDLVEEMIRECLREVAGIALDDPFPRISWAEAMRRYGSDKPDLRCPLELIDVADALRHVEFKVFAAPANDPNCRVIALKAPGGASLARGQIDAYQPFVARYGAKGLAWIRIDDLSKGREGLTSPIVKFLDDDALEGLFAATAAQTGDLLFFGAGPALKTAEFMGQLRLKLGLDLGLTETQSWRPLWVVDFPMFEWDPASQRYYALHHPFTAPKVADVEALRADPAGAVSRGYDMVLNGNEIGGGSIRIHRPELQSAVFELLGIDADEAREKFGFLLEALRYGAPPHGGIAFGIDRIAALVVGADSIREVIAYPKTASAVCPLTRAPSPVSKAQLEELHIAVVMPPVTER